MGPALNIAGLVLNFLGSIGLLYCLVPTITIDDDGGETFGPIGAPQGTPANDAWRRKNLRRRAWIKPSFVALISGSLAQLLGALLG